MMIGNKKKIYFTAGPAKIASEVMEEAHREFFDYKGCGISVLEISHRSSIYDEILTTTEADLRSLMDIPKNYSVLFIHGGAQSQFDSIPMNLCKELRNCRAEYISTGIWSKKAAKEAEKYVKVVLRNINEGNYNRTPVPSEVPIDDNVSYRYYCDNETIQGVEFTSIPHTKPNIPLVCDMTSNFLSRPVDVSKYGVIVASAQKNCGTAGLAIVIVRDDLIGNGMDIVPAVQNWKIMKENRSNYNTPPVYPIYMAGLCFKWIKRQGGLEAMDRMSREKADLLYQTIENSDGFYYCPVEKNSRSRMNVVFLITKSGNKDLQAKFLSEAEENNLFELKGHRLVGGLRASIYHGVTLDDVKVLVLFMQTFQAKYKTSALE